MSGGEDDYIIPIFFLLAETQSKGQLQRRLGNANFGGFSEEKTVDYCHNHEQKKLRKLGKTPEEDILLRELCVFDIFQQVFIHRWGSFWSQVLETRNWLLK